MWAMCLIAENLQKEFTRARKLTTEQSAEIFFTRHRFPAAYRKVT
jgi:hypothetical protein